jgi:hypothetical protein
MTYTTVGSQNRLLGYSVKNPRFRSTYPRQVSHMLARRKVTHRFARFIPFAVAAITVVAGGCGHNTSNSRASISNAPGVQQGANSSGQWSAYESLCNYAQEHGSVVYHVTYQPNAVVFDEQATEHALKDISADGVTYTLDAGSPLAAQLKPGSVLFLYGIAIRKVTAVQTQGSNLLVTTADADITDAIKEGHIAWQVPLDLGSGTMADQQTEADHAVLEDLFATRAAADESLVDELELGKLSVEGSVGPMDYELEFARAPDRLNIDIDVKLSRWGEFWEAKGEGYVRHVTDIGDIDIQDGRIAHMEAAFQDLQGHIDFTTQAQTQHAGPIQLMDQSFKLKIPGLGMEYPMILLGLPFVLELSAAVLVHPAFTGSDEVTQGKFAVDYSGKEGLHYTPAAPEPEGAVEGNEGIDNSMVFGARTLGFVAALELPRLEMDLAVMSLSNIREAQQLPSTHKNLVTNGPGYGYMVGSAAEHIYLRQVITTRLSQFIEEVAIPVKPYAFADIVTSTETFTNGAMTSTLVGLPPCQRTGLKVTGNVGLGAKLSFAHHLPLPSVLGKTASFETIEAAKPVFSKEITRWKLGLKCPGD